MGEWFKEVGRGVQESSLDAPRERGPLIGAGTGGEVMEAKWVVWQLLDSAFPTGGFAHSGGLEAAWQAGEVRGAEGLRGYVRASLWQVGPGVVPLVTAVVREPERVMEMDELAEAMLTNHVANRASRAQGQALVAAAERIYRWEEVGEMRRKVRSGEVCGHLGPVFGWVMGRLGVGVEEAGEVYLFMGVRGLVSAGVRLGVVGPLEGQRIQHELGGEAMGVAREAAELGVEEVATTGPLLESFHLPQDRLYSRLFQS